MKLELVGVPYTSMARPGGIANAIQVLRDLGLAESIAAAGDARDGGNLELLEGSGVRGQSGLLNERALGRLVEATREAVAGSLDRGRLPLLVGGDCPVLLGALAAGRDLRGASGLLFVDGHEDAWPPHRSPTGEASDCEIGIALGRIDRDLPAPLDRLSPLLTPEALTMLGARDGRELEREGEPSLAETVALFQDDSAIHAEGAAASAGEAIGILDRSAPAFWLHLDLDVLRTEDLPAVDYQQPGGLAWSELLELAACALTAPGCLGCSVVVYNPDLDPDRTSGTQLLRFLSALVGAVR